MKAFFRSICRLGCCAVLLSGWATIVRSQEQVVRPASAPGPLDNPLKGWTPYVDAGPIAQPYSMVFLYVPWCQLEPAEGDYRFEEWEQTWDVAAARGKHIIFRVYVDYPGRLSGLPDWLRQAGVGEQSYSEHRGGKSPDYNHPAMVAGLERFIAALGQRYNQHPRIAFVQLGLLGFWGEWHTWPREDLAPSEDTERRVIAAYHKAFPDKSLMVRYARGAAGSEDWIGFHDDMFPEDTDNGHSWSFLAGLRKAGRTENWKRAVVGGEMVPHQAGKWLGDEMATTQTMLQRAHFSWVGPYCPALVRNRDPNFLEQSRTLVRSMGYEYQLRELRVPASIRSGHPFTLRLTGVNQGVAPFYYRWPVQWALLDSKGQVQGIETTSWDLRKWLPGSETIELSDERSLGGDFTEQAELCFSVPAGEYRLAIGVRDPWQDKPAITFANELPVIDGWTVISDLQVKP